MHSLTAKDLLAAWERGLSQTSARRVITLLAEVYPELGEGLLLQLPLGQRDSLVLAARERLFGNRLVSLAQCPTCAQPLEFELGVGDIRVAELPPLPEQLSCEREGYVLDFRLPDSHDLMFAEAQANPEAAYHALMSRCLLGAKRGKHRHQASELPVPVLAALEDAMAAADPQANTQLDLNCPACAHRWLAAFDIASFLWRELHAWAQRLIGEIHLLAKHYSWTEADILAMTPTRRRLYLEQLS
jgi:hypothetical protein